MTNQVYVRTILTCIMLIAGCTVSAQSKFTEHVKSQQTGERKVVIIQTPQIDDVVNNTPQPVKNNPATPSNEQRGHDSSKKPSESNGKDKPAHSHVGDNNHNPAETTPVPSGTRHRYKGHGYRIQIYTGNNSHNDKMKAYAIGETCQKKFPMLSVYPRFINPRWVCRVGDFRTHEDAQEYAKKIRASGISREVRIVRCEVLLAR